MFTLIPALLTGLIIFFSRPQSGAGGPYFVGVPYQRGAGIGSLFRRLMRLLLPVITNAGKELTKESISTGVKVLSEIADGKNVRDSLVGGTGDALKNIVRRTDPSTGLVNLIDRAQQKLQKGGGRKKRFTRAINTRKKRSVRLDALGCY